MGETMKALRQLEYAQPLQVVDFPIPQAESGTAVVKIVAANIISYMNDVYNGARKFPYPTPLTVGVSAIGRVHELGPDATSLQKGQLVFIDPLVRSRDDPTDMFLSAMHSGATPGSKKLMTHFRDGPCAEYMSVTLECCYPCNEDHLFRSSEQGGQGCQLEDLLYMPNLLVPYGGLTDINLKPGETIIIVPATGGFGGAAVHCALSLGARVIAMGRNKDSLARLTETFSPHFPPGRLVTVPATGKLEEELAAIKKAAAGGPIDALFEISPPHATDTTHLKAGMLCLRHGGRVSLMGGRSDDVGIPHAVVVHRNLTIKGKWMYERQDVRNLIRMVENGVVVPRYENRVRRAKAFGLEDWQAAFKCAEEGNSGISAYFKL